MNVQQKIYKSPYPYTVLIFNNVDSIFFRSYIEEIHTDVCEADAEATKEVFKLRAGAPCQNPELISKGQHIEKNS